MSCERTTGRGSESGSNEAAPHERRVVLQWSLKTLFLLTAVVAVWVAYLHFCYKTPRLKRRIATMQGLACELVINDRQQIAAVRLPQMWSKGQRWDVYLPRGRYVIRLATREVGEEQLAPVVEEKPILAGRHQIELIRSEEDGGRRITVLVDGQGVIDSEEDASWNPGRGSGGTGVSRTNGKDAAEPLILSRDRFYQPITEGTSQTPEGPANGILLWIEQIAPASP